MIFVLVIFSKKKGIAGYPSGIQLNPEGPLPPPPDVKRSFPFPEGPPHITPPLPPPRHHQGQAAADDEGRRLGRRHRHQPDLCLPRVPRRPAGHDQGAVGPVCGPRKPRLWKWSWCLVLGFRPIFGHIEKKRRRIGLSGAGCPCIVCVCMQNCVCFFCGFSSQGSSGTGHSTPFGPF